MWKNSVRILSWWRDSVYQVTLVLTHLQGVYLLEGNHPGQLILHSFCILRNLLFMWSLLPLIRNVCKPSTDIVLPHPVQTLGPYGTIKQVTFSIYKRKTWRVVIFTSCLWIIRRNVKSPSHKIDTLMVILNICFIEFYEGWRSSWIPLVRESDCSYFETVKAEYWIIPS